MRTVRDGLLPGHDAREQLAAARSAGIQAIWDLSHYHRNDNPARDARTIAEAATIINGSERLWLCPVNEPEPYTRIAGMPRQQAINMAVTMARAARDWHPDVGILTSDLLTGIGDRQFSATDAIVAAVDVDVIGVNYYPHTARTALAKVLIRAWKRYRKPVMVSENSWHDGHSVHHRRHPGFQKGIWLSHVLDEVDIARRHGVIIAGVCWYLNVDCPPWHTPRARRRWSHGLIRSDLSVDPALSSALMAHHDAAVAWGPGS